MLTDVAIRKAKPAAKPLKLSDGRGMYLLLKPDGGRYWRMDYRHAGKRKTLALGVYPEVSLFDARLRREDARQVLANGLDPGTVRKDAKQARCEVARASDETFEAISRDWMKPYAKPLSERDWFRLHAPGTFWPLLSLYWSPTAQPYAAKVRTDGRASSI
ncbi:Arm DNA-binding domain-containing protein [Rhodanobacter sp. MP1X3]|uniref:Arm DNA-binding domain-containing protein n=1 Tax=Rhodanobacter sp. MP1X3 TaxID=2723086 RepID=UPI0016196C50|nr:Arm DNA-binding domain-containing protein [Rhodanobacter sp. MP1X3]MBB6244284.1 hypothetical protein [Rhodanobacter sp. MP1X3]